MTRVISVYFDLIILMLSLVVASSSVLATIVVLSGSMIAYTHDKTGMETMNEIVTPVPVRTGFDLLTSLVNTDAMTPYPFAMKIDGSPIIKLDSTFQPNKIDTIASIYNDPTWGLKTRLNLNVREVRFETIETDSDGNGIPDGWTDYLHYYITTAP